MTVHEPLISVVIPAYNYAATLPRAVESVLVQLDEASAELIVIDDGSTDDTPVIIEALLAARPQFRSLRKENGGAASVRNRGIREARGTYLIFLDADDELAPGGESRASHRGTKWTIRNVGGGNIPAGQRARVVKTEGLVLHVSNDPAD